MKQAMEILSKRIVQLDDRIANVKNNNHADVLQAIEIGQLESRMRS